MTVSVTFTPNPNFGRDLKKMIEDKFRSALIIRCSEHNQTARIEGNQIIGCCYTLERRVKAELEKK
jgi:hypothetical protein